MADDKESNHADDMGGSLAADEPTAVWDASALRDAGLSELMRKRDSEPSPAATAPEKASNRGPTIVVDTASAGMPPQPGLAAQGKPAKSEVMGWVSTVALAAGLGAAVYLAIRFLR